MVDSPALVPAVTQKDLSLFAYQAIGNPEKQKDFLPAFAEILGAKAAAIAIEDLQHEWATLYLTHGMDRDTVNSYCRYYVSVNPYGSRRPRSPGAVGRGPELISDAEFLDSEYYHGWYKPRGWRHPFTITLDVTETTTAYLWAVRPPNYPFTEKEMVIVNELAPHLAEATKKAKERIALKNENYRLLSRKHQHHQALKRDVLARFHLTPAERSIAAALREGEDIKEIAHKRGITEGTLRQHQKKIYTKFDVHSRAEFMRRLQELSRQ
jgi:DNA-binding CsgD family transcriptional regulator